MSKTKKNQRFYGLLLKSLLFISLIGVISVRLAAEDWSGMDILRLENPVFLFLSVFLVFFNQGCEWMKWKLTANQLIDDKTVLRKAFLGGLGTGFLTPNGWGNFLGRIVYFRKRDRMFIVLSTFVSNVSQVLPTLIFGGIACWFTSKLPTGTGWITLISGAIILLVFFFGERLFPAFRTRNKWIRHFRLLKGKLGRLRLPMFIWSNLRFLVFSLQYVLLFRAFGYSDWWFCLLNVWLLFLLTSFVPSLWSGKIVIRETAAIFLFSGSPVALPDVVIICLLIWLINSVLPALAGSIAWIPFTKRSAHVVD